MNITHIWQDFLSMATAEVGSRVVETWFKAVTFSRWDSATKTVQLHAPNSFTKEWIQSRYTSLLKQHLSRLLQETSISILILDESTKPVVQSFDTFYSNDVHTSSFTGNEQNLENGNQTLNDTRQAPFNAQSHNEHALQNEHINTAEKASTFSKSAATVKNVSDTSLNEKARTIGYKPTGIAKINATNPWNPRYQFDNYVVGEHNALAFAAMQAVAELPGQTYNPLCIYGGSGIGKTHLLQAAAHKIKALRPETRVIYQTGDRFVHEFVHAIRTDKIAQFEQRYREVDVLMIDDIQCLANKEQTQEALYQIFNTLIESRKQVIFSTNTLPQTLPGISDRLRNRLDAGLIADIQVPTLETKVEIIKKKAETQQQSVGDDIAHLIASRVSSNIRELESLLIRVLAFATLTHQILSLDLAHKVLARTANSCAQVQQQKLTMPALADAVCKHYKVSMQDVRSSKRLKHISLARHVAMYAIKQHTNHSLNDIAAYFCRKDHTTVLHAVQKIAEMKKSDSNFDKEVSSIEKSFQRIK